MGNPSAYIARAASSACRFDLQASRITDAATANHAIEDGCLDLVGMVRYVHRGPHRPQTDGGRRASHPACVGAGHRFLD